MNKLLGVVLLLVSGAAYALTPQEIKATRPEDLGPESIDVSGYPAPQQENYKLFLARCSTCHSPARAIYSKVVSRPEWEHFVPLMRSRLLARNMKPVWTPKEGERISDFLAYDSYIRKVEKKLEFEQSLRELEKQFKQLQKQKAESSTHQPTQPEAPYVGDKP